MSNQENLKQIKKITEEFFQKACFEITVEVSPEQAAFFIKINSDEPQILIGEKGQVLSEIQHLLRLIVRKQLGQPFFLNIDINDYKAKKNDYLKELARSTADEVVLSKRKKEMPPMPAYERRVIHLELADRHDISTESVGEGEERRVVVQPKI